MTKTQNTIDNPMENKNIRIWCANSQEHLDVTPGTTLDEIAERLHIELRDEKTGRTMPVLAALVDHRLKELSYPLVMSHEVEFIGCNHAEGRRTYIRSLCFVLQKAVRDLFPDSTLVIDHSLPSGLYCELKEKAPVNGHHPVRPVGEEEVRRLGDRMRAIVAADLPFTKTKVRAEEAIALFEGQGQPHKAELLRSLGECTVSIYALDSVQDTFYGPLAPSTACLDGFALSLFAEGFCLRLPDIRNPLAVKPMEKQDKIAAALSEYSRWCDIIGVTGAGSLNRAILSGHAVDVINISEAMHGRKYAAIADEISRQRDRIRIVLIAGPSSSGKTSSSLRIALECRTLGLTPKVIELDNYFVDREKTPRDENGEYDFEHLHAMDLDLLGRQLNQLLAGEEVETPVFDFKKGARSGTGKRMRLEKDDILIMEGIHALNPEMTSAVDDSRILRVYVSALTSLNLDENNHLSTSDNRLLRRLVRDNRVRGITPEETLLRWHSVRRGESRNIFPFQENADVIFNSALAFELPALKYYAEPLLRRILPNSPAYTEAVRLLKFLRCVTALQPSEIQAIPPTSILREFLGGQTLS